MKFIWFGLALFLLAIFAGFAYWYSSSLQPVSTSTELQTFIIGAGDPAALIIQNLSKQGLIRAYYPARLYHKLHPVVFRPGVYYLSSDKTIQELFAQISRGPKDIKITFPEGWRREQFASRLKANFPEFDTQEFLRLTATLEGRLFPDTYYLPASPTAEKIVSILTQNFAKKSGLTDRQTQELIVASLIERESNNSGDSPIIAGIIYKRLENGWPLQIDATIQYAKDSAQSRNRPLDYDYWRPIYDTKFDSPYNTYQNTGLPPGPISSPGISAIQSALNPVETKYWYYLTGNDGKTYFSENLTTHQLLIDTHLKP